MLMLQLNQTNQKNDFPLYLLLMTQLIYNINLKMQNIDEEEQNDPQKVPSSKPTKSMSKIINTRFLNQNIYTTFLQKRYGECLSLIERSGNKDEFKLYIQSLIEKTTYKLDKSLDLLNLCHIMDKNNFYYLKSISKNYYLLGKYKSSLEVAKEAHRMNSNDYQIFYILGKISLALGDQSGALDYFKKSQGKQPNEESLLQQAKIHMNNQQYVLAEDLLNECIRISPQNPEAFQMLGLSYSKMGKNEDAYRAYRLALQVDAGRYISLVGMGSIELEKNLLDQALTSFTKAYKTSSNSAALWNNIGITMVQKSKFVVAYCCFKRALFLDPFRWNFHTNLALLFIKKAKYLPAKIHLQSALKLNKDPTLFNLLGVCLLELNDPSNAERAFEQSIKMNSSYYEARYNLILCLLKQGNKEKSANLFDSLLREGEGEDLKDRLLQMKRKYFD